MNEDNEIYEYCYLDSNIALNREETLKNFLIERKESSEMFFYDLDFYLKDDLPFQKIKKIANRSVFNPNICLIDSQIEILSILESHSLFLSAPTSFGKTFIVLEYIARHKQLKNIVFIVPTIALMNELLKKIYEKFSSYYNICINGDERIEERNIFIFVPERSDYKFVKKISQCGLDLLIIDEIYKLKINKKQLKSDDRFIVMNKVYLNLIKIAHQIILLGPFIKEVSFENTKIDIVKYYTNLLPIYNCVEDCSDKNWIDYMGGEKELVFFSSPESIYDNIGLILAKFSEDKLYIERYKEEIEYLQLNIYREWYAVELLKRGIGVHHGKTPMFLRKFYEDEFNNGKLKCLLCTQTLMEGVNTPTMKLLIVDNPGSIFALNNLIGRAGRLNIESKEYGHVYIFNKKASNMFGNKSNWEKLTILAEDQNVYVDDEVLYLDKKYKDEEKAKLYREKIETIMAASQKTEEEIKEYDIKIDIAYKFVDGDFKNLFLSSEKIIDCIKHTCSLIKKVGFLFEKKNFVNIDYPVDNLPSNYFIFGIISGKTFNEIISDFERLYGKLSIENTNLFIDKLFNLKIIIKFKLSKILNYLDLFNVDISANNSLKMFCAMMTGFSDLEINEKILEDLGIEECDHKTISKELPKDKNPSVSDVMTFLKENKEKFNVMDLSPFTKRSIKKI